MSPKRKYELGRAELLRNRLGIGKERPLLDVHGKPLQRREIRDGEPVLVRIMLPGEAQNALHYAPFERQRSSVSALLSERSGGRVLPRLKS